MWYGFRDRFLYGDCGNNARDVIFSIVFLVSQYSSLYTACEYSNVQLQSTNTEPHRKFNL